VTRNLVLHLGFVALLLDAVVVNIDVQSVLDFTAKNTWTLLVVMGLYDWAHVGHTTFEVLIVFLIHFYNNFYRFA